MRNIRTDSYSSVVAALGRLRRWFGSLPSQLTDYHTNVSPEGWLLAFEAEVVGPVQCKLPTGHKLGRNGFARIHDPVARSIGLPQAGRPASVPVDTEPVDPGILAPLRVRHIPQVVKDAVFERDGRVCQQCSATDGTMHLDHIHPWSKGGSNTVDNLQVLCASCNMAKGAAAVAGRTAVPAVHSLVELAHDLGENPPSTPAHLQALLERASSDDKEDQLVAVMWDLFHHPDFDGEIHDAVGDALDSAQGKLGAHRDVLDALEAFLTNDLNEEDARVKEEGACELEELLESDELAVAARAAAYLSLADLPAERQLELAQFGLTSGDLRVQAVARYVIAGQAEDDDVWRDSHLFAIDHGDPVTSTAAAGDFGAQVEEKPLAYFYLEQGLRSPLLSVARNAANSIADLFADDPGRARIYRSRAEEIQALMDS